MRVIFIIFALKIANHSTAICLLLHLNQLLFSLNPQFIPPYKLLSIVATLQIWTVILLLAFLCISRGRAPNLQLARSPHEFCTMIKYWRQPIFIRSDQYHLLGILIMEVKESSASDACYFYYFRPQNR